MGRRVGGAAVGDGKGVAVDCGRDKGLRAPVAIVAVPFGVGGIRVLELERNQMISLLLGNNNSSRLSKVQRTSNHTPVRCHIPKLILTH